MLNRLSKLLPAPARHALWIRRVRYRFVRDVRRAAAGQLRIVVGASNVSAPGWIQSEAEFLDLLDADAWERYFQVESVDAILAEHVWEHLSETDGLTAARQCYRFLKSGGYLRLAVPDGNQTAPGYIRYVDVDGTGPGADDHKVLYTAASFSELLREAGFEPQLLEYFDDQGSFHEVPWDPDDGMIHRSRRFDPRNRGRLGYTSLIIDARKRADATVSQ